MKLKRHNLDKVVVTSILVFGLFSMMVLPIVASEMSFAEPCTGDACLDVEVTVPEYISITNAESIPDEILIDNTTGKSSSQAVIVATNISGGYVLTAKAISTDTTSAISNKMLRRNGSGTALSNDGINSTATKLTYANMANKTWGLAVDGTYFRPIARDGVPAESGIIAYSKVPVLASTTNVTFAAKATDSDLVAGTYSTTIQFTALGNDGTDQTLYGD